jgi:DNA-binding winged helix-turn-helix (wHTH) protein/TolB-like protein/Tfp pilus assembly protein PilF
MRPVSVASGFPDPVLSKWHQIVANDKFPQARSPSDFSKSSQIILKKAMSEPARDFYEFGNFKIDAVERLLLRAGQPVQLTQKVFDLLLLLVQNGGHVVEKDRLMKEIWPDSFVEEGNLTQNISVLRKVLSDEGHQYIQTVPRRGYRFVGHLRQVIDDSELVIEEHSLARMVVEEQSQDVRTISPASAITLAKSNAQGRSRHWPLDRTWLWISIAVAGALVTIGYFSFAGWSKMNRSAVVSPSGSRSIAVLPFQNLAANGGDEFLGLGMTDALISRLSNIRRANVRPTSAVQKYSAWSQDAAAIGKELQVDSVLTGTVQKDSDRIRVSVQLIDVNRGEAIWAHAFDEKFTDIFAVEDAISGQIAQAITPKLTEDERARLAKHYTDDPAAHELYLQGRFHLNKFTQEGTQLARQYFEQAIAKDPGYALAYAGLAESYAFGEIGLPPAEAFPKARDAATKAIELDETVGEAHAALAQVAFLWDWDWDAAEKQFKRALELTPADPEIHHMYAHYLTAMGRFDEALAESQRLLELDPLSPASRNHLGWHYLYAHQFDQAIEQYQLVLTLDPNFAEAHRQMAEAYAEKGRLDDAVAETLKRWELIGRANEVPALKLAYAQSGWKGFWQKRLELALERGKHTYVAPSGNATTCAMLKDTLRTLDWLERAYREHDMDLVYLKVDHNYDGIRSEPRFQELQSRMRLN